MGLPAGRNAGRTRSFWCIDAPISTIILASGSREKSSRLGQAGRGRAQNDGSWRRSGGWPDAGPGPGLTKALGVPVIRTVAVRRRGLEIYPLRVEESSACHQPAVSKPCVRDSSANHGLSQTQAKRIANLARGFPKTRWARRWSEAGRPAVFAPVRRTDNSCLRFLFLMFQRGLRPGREAPIA